MFIRGRHLAFIAILHGGLLLGLGNAFFPATTISEDAHEHHATHTPGGVFEPIPAHCLFCLDGIAPSQPDLPPLLSIVRWQQVGTLVFAADSFPALSLQLNYVARAPPELFSFTC